MDKREEISLPPIGGENLLTPEESPDDLDKNHQVKVDAHLVM